MSGSGNNKRRRLDSLPAMPKDADETTDDGVEALSKEMEFCASSTTATTVPTVPTLVELLRRDDSPALQLEAACCLTNIIHSGRTSLTVDTTSDHSVCMEHILADAIPELVRLLGNSPSHNVREQAVCALGNMARDSVNCRDAILRAGVLSPLLEQLDPYSTEQSLCQNDLDEDEDKQDGHSHYVDDGDSGCDDSGYGDSTTSSRRSRMLCSGTWALAGLCLGKPSPDLSVIRAALPTLVSLLEYWDDEMVLKQACTTLASLSGGSMAKKQAVIDAGVCARLVYLLDNKKSSSSWPMVQEAAVRTLAIIMSGNPNHHPCQTQAVIQHVLDCDDGSVLPRLRALLDSPVTEIRKYTCWAICNITSGQDEDHIQAVIHHNIIPPLIHLFVHGDEDSRKQAFLTVLNALARGTAHHVQYIVQHGCIEPIADLLMVSDPTMIRVALVALESILRVGQEVMDMAAASTSTSGTSGYSPPMIHNPMALLICQAKGLTKIRKLRQLYAHDFICTQCTRILELYFGEVEIADIAPAA